MSPPQDIGDQALIGAAQPSGAASRSTADDNALLCGGTASPWTPISTSQYWNGSTWDNTVTALPIAAMFGGGGGNYDDYLFAGGDTSGTDTPTQDTFQWNGSAWTAEGSGYPQTDEIHDGGFAFGGNTSEAFIHAGHDGYTSTPYYKTYSGRWTGTAWVSSVASSYGGQGTAGGGLPDDFIATGGYGYNGGASLVSTYKTESFNGDSWTDEDDFPTDAADSATPFAYGNYSAGGRETYLAFANSTSLTNCAFTYDGDSWTGAGTLAENAHYASSGGDSSTAIIAGGNDNSWDLVASQLYNGDTFTSKADIDTGATAMAMGANTV